MRETITFEVEEVSSGAFETRGNPRAGEGEGAADLTVLAPPLGHVATSLHLKPDNGWTKEDDKVLWMLRGTHLKKGNSTSTTTPGQLAEMLGKTMKDITARERFLKENCRKNRKGTPLTDMCLVEVLSLARSEKGCWFHGYCGKLTRRGKFLHPMRLLWRAWRDPQIREVSLPPLRLSCGKLDDLASDVESFLLATVLHVKSTVNEHDLVETEDAFSQVSLKLDKFVPHMCVWLRRSGRRDEEYLTQNYVDQRDVLRVKRYLIQNYVHEFQITADTKIEEQGESESDGRSLGDTDVLGKLVEANLNLKEIGQRVQFAKQQQVKQKEQSRRDLLKRDQQQFALELEKVRRLRKDRREYRRMARRSRSESSSIAMALQARARAAGSLVSMDVPDMRG